MLDSCGGAWVGGGLGFVSQHTEVVPLLSFVGQQNSPENKYFSVKPGFLHAFRHLIEFKRVQPFVCIGAYIRQNILEPLQKQANVS